MLTSGRLPNFKETFSEVFYKPGDKVPENSEIVTWASPAFGEAKITAEHSTKDSCRLYVTNRKTGKRVFDESSMDFLSLRRTPAVGSAFQTVWMHPNECGLKGGNELSDYPEEVLGLYNDIKLEHWGHLGSLSLYNKNNNESAGEISIRAYQVDDNTVQIDQIHKDNYNGNDALHLAMYKVCKDSPGKTILFDAVYNPETISRVKNTYSMQPKEKGSLVFKGDADVLLEKAKSKLYNWSLR